MKTDELRMVLTSDSAASVTTTVTTLTLCRAVYVGVSQSIDLYVEKSGWVTFKGASAGSVIPVQATGARTSTPDNPAAGDIVFLY